MIPDPNPDAVTTAVPMGLTFTSEVELIKAADVIHEEETP